MGSALGVVQQSGACGAVVQSGEPVGGLLPVAGCGAGQTHCHGQCSFEIGIHNSTLAIFVAMAVLGNLQLALPAATISVSMYLTATAFGFLVLRRGG